jgi:hypothetical protein
MSKINIIKENNLKVERLKYFNKVLINFKYGVIKKDNNFKQSNIEQLPLEIISLIYSFIFDSIYLFGSIDGRYNSRARYCSVFFLDLYFSKKILFFSNSERFTLKSTNQNLSSSSSFLEQ